MFSKFETQRRVVRMSKTETKLQEHLNADTLFSLVHSGFKRIKRPSVKKHQNIQAIHAISYSHHSNCLRLYHRSWLICVVKRGCRCLRNGKETVPRLHAFTIIAGIAAPGVTLLYWRGLTRNTTCAKPGI